MITFKTFKNLKSSPTVCFT